LQSAFPDQGLKQVKIDHTLLHENENHNVLKNKGYHLEHKFGHGQLHLASTLLTLNLLAFLFHTVFHLVDIPYQQIRQMQGTRKGFFQDILGLTKYLLFDSLQHLIDFMLSDSEPSLTLNSSIFEFGIAGSPTSICVLNSDSFFSSSLSA
jgi:hypothetical protein